MKQYSQHSSLRGGMSWLIKTHKDWGSELVDLGPVVDLYTQKNMPPSLKFVHLRNPVMYGVCCSLITGPSRTHYLM